MLAQEGSPAFFFFFKISFSKMFNLSESVSSSVKLEFLLSGLQDIISSAIIILKPLICSNMLNKGKI